MKPRFGLKALVLLTLLASIAFLVYSRSTEQARLIRRLERLGVELLLVESSSSLAQRSGFFVSLPDRGNYSSQQAEKVIGMLAQLGDCGLLEIRSDWELDQLSRFIHLDSLIVETSLPIDLKTLSDIKGIGSLTVACPRLLNLDEIKNFSALEDLRVNCESLVDISSIGDCDNLRHLEFLHCGIVDLSPLQRLSQLKSLRLADLASIGKSVALPSLYELTFVNCEVKDVENFLAQNPQLETCFVFRESLVPISLLPFTRLDSLKKLAVSCPADVSLVEQLTDLEYLELSNCALDDEEVDAILQLPNLNSLWLTNVILSPGQVSQVRARFPKAFE